MLPYTGMHCPTMILYQPCGRPIAHPQYREEPRSQIRAPRVPEDGPLVARALPGHNQGGESETRVSQDWLQHVLDIVSKPSKIRGCSDTFRHAPFICTSAAGHTGSRNQRRSRIERFADQIRLATMMHQNANSEIRPNPAVSGTSSAAINHADAASSAAEAPLLSIRESLAGSVVFITGVTGYLGSLVLEQLLRTCPGERQTEQGGRGGGGDPSVSAGWRIGARGAWLDWFGQP